MKLNELFYPGNIGVMEMFRFNQVATTEQKRKLHELIAKKDFKAAWELMQQVTGMKLHGLQPR